MSDHFELSSLKKRSRGEIPDRVSGGNVIVRARLGLLDRTQPHAVLATDFNGQPYTSLVAYALTPDQKGLLFTTPRSTQKHRNILKNRKVSLLIDSRTNTAKDYMAAEAVTVLGRARAIRKGKKWVKFADIFLKKHQTLKGIMHSSETALILVEITKCIHATKFQSISVWDVK